MFYVARWYDPYLNRFIQPDTIVPAPNNPMDWDRYAYSANNPVRYIDPSGHDYYEPGCDCMVHTGEDDKHLSNYDPGPYCDPFCGQPDPGGLSDEQIGDLDPVAKFILAWWAEPLDWLITYGDCQSQDCGFGTWAMTLIPGAWGLFGKRAGDTMTLYRAVSPGEFDDIMSSGVFRPKSGGASMDGKWFSETLEGAVQWGEKMFDEYVVVAVEVSVDVADTMFRVDKLDMIAPARFAIDDVLDSFNQAIHSISVAFGGN